MILIITKEDKRKEERQKIDVAAAGDLVVVG